MIREMMLGTAYLASSFPTRSYPSGFSTVGTLSKTREMQEDILRRVYDYMASMFAGISEENLKIFESVIMQMTRNADK